MKKKPSCTRVRKGQTGAAASPDDFETTRQKIASLENAAVAFVGELRKLPQWQQRAIVDEVYDLANHGLRYLRIVIAGVQCTRASSGRAKPRRKHAANGDFAKKFVEVWSNRIAKLDGETTPNKSA